jgi:L-cysteine desulfidase
VLRVDMVGCGLMVTGVQAVGIPNTGGKTGAFLASAVGIVNGDAEACKEVLHNIRPEDVVAAEELIQNAEFTLDMDNSTGKQVYFKLTLTTDEHVATVIFEDEHHTWTYLEADGKVLVDNRKPAGEMLIPANDIDWDVFTIENIYNWCKTADISEFGRAKEAVEMNTKVATDGLENPRGIQTARILRKNVESGFVAEDEITHVLMWGTAGPDARMGGSDYPTMVSTASGNQGLMVVMAPWASAQYRKMSAEDGYRAVAFALLMNTFMKYASKEYVYMPPTCSCATTAAPAAAAGVAFLHGLTPQQINDMLCTAQVQMAGVVCDGAKPSCATRMYVALFGSLQAMMMAKEGIRATNVEGFVHNDLKVTLENLYRLQHDVLHNKVDAILWDIVKEQKVIH